jgi:DNA-binding NarL/FixJ family response regulator
VRLGGGPAPQRGRGCGCDRLGRVQLARGRLHAARRTHGQALELAAAPDRPVLPSAIAYVGIAEIAYLLQAFELAGLPVRPPPRPGGAAPGGLVLPLSGRELEVLQLLAAWSSNQAIAEELVVTVDTVKSHVTHVLDKLGVAPFGGRTGQRARGAEGRR